MTDSPSPQLDADFMEALNFTLEDLEANRRRRMTPNQVNILQANREKQFILLTLAGIVIASIMLCVANIDNRAEEGQGTFFGVVTFAILIFLAGFMFKRHSDIAHDLKRQVVVRVSGRIIKKLKHIKRGGKLYYIRVQSVQLLVPPRVYEAFQDQSLYTIYYAPTSKFILSAESIEPKS